MIKPPKFLHKFEKILIDFGLFFQFFNVFRFIAFKKILNFFFLIFEETMMIDDNLIPSNEEIEIILKSKDIVINQEVLTN